MHLADVTIGTTGQQFTLKDNPSFNFANSSIGDILKSSMVYVFSFAGIGLLLMIIAAGFGLLTSAGDAKKTAASQQQLTFAVVGFLIIFLAYWITQIAGNIFGIDAIKNSFQ